MAVSQRLIDLLNVPLDQLRDAAEKEEIEGARGLSKWGLAQALEGRDRGQLEKLSRGYLYAGRTSLSWFRFAEPRDPEADDGEDEDGHGHPPTVLEGVELEVEGAREALNELSESDDAFNETLRPAEITRDPKLVVARERPDGAFMLTFAVERPAGRVIRNFVDTRVFQDSFFNVVLDWRSGIVEVRTSQQMARHFSETWLKEFAELFELEAVAIGISERDALALEQELNADLGRYRGRQEDSDTVDSIEIIGVRGAQAGMRDSDDFEELRAGSQQTVGDLRFEFDDAEYTVRVSSLKGSIYFVTPAPESALDYVRDALRKIKVRHHQG